MENLVHRPLRVLRVPLLIMLLLLVLSLPSLLGCACGGFSLLPLLSRATCTPPPPVATPSITMPGDTGTPGLVTPTLP